MSPGHLLWKLKQTKKPKKDETDSWTALFPEPDIARPGYFIPKFMQFKMYTT